jgi:fibronectin-binding autotransporter adhesin
MPSDQINDAGSFTTSNIVNVAAYTGSTASNVSIQSLNFRFNDTSSFAISDSLTIITGGIMVSNSVTNNAQTINGPGALLTPSGIDLVVSSFQNSTTQALSIASPIGASTGTGTPAAVVKSGTGVVTLSAQNFTTGGLLINSGALNADFNVAYTANITMNNATAATLNPLGRNGTNSSLITLGDGATLNIRSGTGTNTSAVNITLGNSIIVPTGTGTLNLNRLSGSITNKVHIFGNLTIGDNATFEFNNGGIPGYRPQYGTIFLTGRAGTISPNGSFNTFTAGLSGIAGGSVFNIAGTVDLTFNGGGTTNIALINILSGRLFLANTSISNTVGTTPIAIGPAASPMNGPAIFSQVSAALTLSQLVTIGDNGGIGTRAAMLTFANLAGFPTQGRLVLNNDSAATTTVALTGTYPTLTGDVTFQFSGNRLTNSSLAIGNTSLASGFALGGINRTITFDYAPTASSTPITTSRFSVNGPTTLDADLTIAGDGAATFNGTIGETGLPRNLTKSGTGILTLGGANTFSGLTTPAAGQLTLTNTSSLAGSTLNLATGDTGVVNFFTGTNNLGGLTGARSIASAQPLSVGANNLSPNYSGVLSGAASLTKVGTGTLTLSGENTYAGPTTIDAGMLSINGNALAATGAVTVNTTATLQGNGVVGGAVTVNSGGTIRGGNSVGTITLASGLTVNANATIAIEIDDGSMPAMLILGNSTVGPLPNPTSNSYFNITGGTTTIDPGALVFVDATGATFINGEDYSFQIAQGAGNQSSLNIPSAQITFAGVVVDPLSVNLSGSMGGQIYLNFTPVPEPMGLFAMIAVAGACVRRRRV